MIMVKGTLINPWFGAPTRALKAQASLGTHKLLHNMSAAYMADLMRHQSLFYQVILDDIDSSLA